MKWRLLRRLHGKDGVGSVLDEERSGKDVSSEDSKMEEAVPLRVLDVQVTLVTDEGIGYPLVAAEEGQVERDVAFRVLHVQLLRKLEGEIRPASSCCTHQSTLVSRF